MWIKIIIGISHITINEIKKKELNLLICDFSNVSNLKHSFKLPLSKTPFFLYKLLLNSAHPADF